LQADAAGYEIAGNDPPGYDGGDLFKNRVAFTELSDIAFITYVTSDVKRTPSFLRGECNDDGTVDLSDAVCIFSWLFEGGDRPGCLDAADTNDTDGHNLTDGIYLLAWLFQGGGPPPAPGPTRCGIDPTDEDGIDCLSYNQCP